MTLRERLNDDFKSAMKNRDEVKKNTISFARAAIKQYEIDNRGETLDDTGIEAIIAKQVKMRRDALSDFEKAGRTDLADAYRAEMEVLMEYLPKQLTDEEIMTIVQDTAASMGISGGKENMGKLMGNVMSKVKGVADGNAVKQAVEQFLSS